MFRINVIKQENGVFLNRFVLVNDICEILCRQTLALCRR